MSRLEKPGNFSDIDREFYGKVYDKSKDDFNIELRMQKHLQFLDALIAEGQLSGSSKISELLEVLNSKKKYYIEGRDMAKDAIVKGRKKSESEFSSLAEMEARKAQQILDSIKDLVLFIDNLKESGMTPETDTIDRLRGFFDKSLRAIEDRMDKEDRGNLPGK